MPKKSQLLTENDIARLTPWLYLPMMLLPERFVDVVYYLANQKSLFERVRFVKILKNFLNSADSTNGYRYQSKKYFYGGITWTYATKELKYLNECLDQLIHKCEHELKLAQTQQSKTSQFNVSSVISWLKQSYTDLTAPKPNSSRNSNRFTKLFVGGLALSSVYRVTSSSSSSLAESNNMMPAAAMFSAALNNNHFMFAPAAIMFLVNTLPSSVYAFDASQNVTFLQTFGEIEQAFVRHTRTLEGNILLVGSNNRATFGFNDQLISLWDNNGTLITAHDFGTRNGDFAKGVALTAANQFVVVGNTGVPGRNSEILVTQWQLPDVFLNAKILGGINIDDALDVVADPDRNYFIVGDTLSTISPQYRDFFAASFNANHTLKWARTIGLPDRLEYAKGVSLTPDGAIVVVGYSHHTFTEDEKGILVKWWLDGTHAWTKTIARDGNKLKLSAITLTIDNNMLVAGDINYRPTFPEYDCFFTRYDLNGNRISVVTLFGGQKEETVNAVLSTLDGGHIISGRTLSFNGGSGLYESFLAKWLNGTLIWTRLFNIGNNFISALTNIPTGGIIMSSILDIGPQGVGPQNYTILLAKMTDNGQIFNCSNLRNVIMPTNISIPISEEFLSIADENWSDLIIQDLTNSYWNKTLNESVQRRCFGTEKPTTQSAANPPLTSSLIETSTGLITHKSSTGTTLSSAQSATTTTKNPSTTMASISAITTGANLSQPSGTSENDRSIVGIIIGCVLGVFCLVGLLALGIIGKRRNWFRDRNDSRQGFFSKYEQTNRVVPEREPEKTNEQNIELDEMNTTNDLPRPSMYSLYNHL